MCIYAELSPPAALLPSLLPLLLLLSSAGAATLKLRSLAGISSPVFFRNRTLRPSSVTLTPTRLRTCKTKERGRKK
jgi:hypothetical protein